MPRVPFAAVLCVLGAAGLCARGEEPVATLGKQRAARAAIEWGVHDIDHAQLGPIRFAVQKNAVATPAGREKILSLSFVSCQKSTGTVAIELTNAPGSDLAGGLRPTQMPRLVCSSPDPRGRGRPVKSDIAAKWEIGPLGDTLARGLAPSALRRCASIAVLQSVAPPSGASGQSQRIALEITPYDRALDSVFVACGEASAFAQAERAPPASPPAARPEPQPERVPDAQPADAPWQRARTTTRGRTNVRAEPGVDSRIVVALDPGTRILVRRKSGAWWEARPRSGAGFRGYVRQDRFVLE